ncbi:MAG: RagB/SusD family nutrient uptake outer membrane protein, partial [Hymenobacter sp.]
AFEGFRVYDLVRTGRVVGTLPATSPKLILPIPQREINNNSLLTQNAGY